MRIEYFVDEQSIVRQIWGKADTILFIFAGAAAEFALNKSVDWLYFTGRLPADPIGRLFSTVSYARTIVFSEQAGALRAIDAMTAIHAGVEASRGAKIPDAAYRDVLFMLIDYSIRAFGLLERPLTGDEQAEVFEVFNRVGLRMGLQGLPNDFEQWKDMRQNHLIENLQRSRFTEDLFKQYRKHLGNLRYRILLGVQAIIVPSIVRQLLGIRNGSFMKALMRIYKWSRIAGLDRVLKAMLLPASYKAQIARLDAPAPKPICPFHRAARLAR